MATKYASAARQLALRQEGTKDWRAYIDFRQKKYPAVAGNAAFTIASAAINPYGSHWQYNTYSKYLLDMPSQFTIHMRIWPQFVYNVASDQFIASWYIDTNNQLTIYYNSGTDKILLYWNCGGTGAGSWAAISSDQFTTNPQIQGSWMSLTAAVDLTTGSTSGSGLYISNDVYTSTQTTWSGNIDSKIMSFPIFNMGAQTTTPADCIIGMVRLIPNYVATAADVANNFKDVKYEEIIWPLNGHATGHSRCNVTSRLLSMGFDRRIESPIQRSCANQAEMVLSSPDGQFADDQTAAFDAPNEVYNGTTSQRYMMNRCGVELESWVNGVPELEFVGRIDDSGFKRRSGVGVKSRVSISALDVWSDIRGKLKRNASKYENYDPCAPNSTGTSLVHTIARLATAPEWYNFFPNSSFENANIGSSCSNTGGVFSRVAGGVLGSYQGDYVTSVSSALYWLIEFSGNKKLNPGENWNWSFYAKANAPITVSAILREYNAAYSITGSITTSASLTTSWQKFNVTKTITSASSAVLGCLISTPGSCTASIDCAMLIQNGTPLDWFVLNSDDGSGGVYDGNNADSSTYDTVGFDVDEAKYAGTTTTTLTHPWAIIEAGDTVGDHLQQIADATTAWYMGLDSAGTLKYRTVFKTGYVDASPIFTVGTEVSSLDSIVTPAGGNKIKVHGVKIHKASADPQGGGYRMVWNAAADSGFPKAGDGGDIYVTVASAATFPDSTAYPEYWAKYGEVV